jgi:hypothetical protein
VETLGIVSQFYVAGNIIHRVLPRRVLGRLTRSFFSAAKNDSANALS